MAYTPWDSSDEVILDETKADGNGELEGKVATIDKNGNLNIMYLRGYGGYEDSDIYLSPAQFETIAEAYYAWKTTQQERQFVGDHELADPDEHDSPLGY